MQRAEWASWAQAVGAIVALIVAISVPYLQRWSDRRAAWQAAVHFAETLVMIAETAVDLPRHEGMDMARTAAVHLRNAQRIGEELNVGLLPRNSLVGVRGLRAIASVMELHIAQIIEKPNQMQTFEQVAKRDLEVVRTYVDRLNGKPWPADF